VSSTGGRATKQLLQHSVVRYEESLFGNGEVKRMRKVMKFLGLLFTAVSATVAAPVFAQSDPSVKISASGASFSAYLTSARKLNQLPPELIPEFV